MKHGALLAFVLMASAPAVHAQEPPQATAPAEQTALETRAAQVVAIINGTLAPQTVFTDAFLAAVPPAQLRAVSLSLTAQYGPAIAVEAITPRNGTRAALAIRFERGIGRGVIGIDPGAENRIGELLFNQFDSVTTAGDTSEKIAADLAALPGTVNAWFAPLDGGAPVIAIGPDKSLALGSTFKLYVLAALAEDVKTGRREWTDVVPLSEKSYPSGKLQEWPAGSPLTLHTLASLMISISDNTATDQLIAVLGKDRILKLMRDSGHSDPGANDPFLTTRLLFLLKASDEARLDRWRNGNAAQRSATEAVLQSEFLAGEISLDRINAAFASGPKALDIEWFASPADLAKLLAHMRRTGDPKVFEIMAINPSATPAIKANWDYLGFKGGSEPGVMNLTWLLQDKAGTWHVLTLGWNNPAASLDEGKLNAIAQRILLLPR